MKKTLSFSLILIAIFLLTFSIVSFADSLDTLNVEVNKQIVNPKDTVTLNFTFGKELGSYKFEVAYDNKLFEYVSSDGGEANDTGEKVILYFFDSTGGSEPRTDASMTFRAKEGITTSNPTNFSITATGLASSDAGVQYDDITVPIVKPITVEPIYEDYAIKLEYTGSIEKNVKKEMKIITSSQMGRYYEHARLVASAITPEGASVQLLATDEEGLEHDIIQSGWGDASGYEIGGNVNQELKTTGIFSQDGLYTITLSLIDRDDSDKEIAKGIFSIDVGEKAVEPEPTVPNNPTQQPETTQPQQLPNETLPTNLPKTGNNILWISIAILFAISVLLIINNRKRRK